MAPSATEAPATVPIPSIGNGKLSKAGVATTEAAVPEQAPKLFEETLPERLTGHKEPLKLSGALDQFEHFDVTPVIGREYVNVSLAELLKAPNSDELIRDLAITSTSRLTFIHVNESTNNFPKSPSAVSSSSASRTTSPTISRRSSSSASANSQGSLKPQSYTFIPLATPAADWTATTKSASSRPCSSRSCTLIGF